MSIYQTHAIATFETMLKNALTYRETGKDPVGFDSDCGICDNIGDSRPDGSSYDDMYRVKDNVIHQLPSWSGSYHYPVPHPSPRPGYECEDAERAWDNNTNKWKGDYGQQRVIQLQELIHFVKTNWDDRFIQRLTPAQQLNIVIHETVLLNTELGTYWVMCKDDDSSAPYFVPLQDKGSQVNRECFSLRTMKVVSVNDQMKRSVKSFINALTRNEIKRKKLEDKAAAIMAQVKALKSEGMMLEYALAEQHSVKMIVK